MTKQVQRRRGTATQHTSFTGAEGELSVNTTNKSVHVHDNVTAGGFEAARADMDNVTSSSILTAAGITATTAELNYVDGVTSAIQTQIDGKAGTASPTFTGTLTTANLTATGTTTLAGASTSADITFGDNDKAVFGAGSDLTIFSDGGTFSYINNTQGVLRIRNTSDDQDVVIQSDNGSGGVTDYFRADGSTGSVKLYNYGAEKLATTSTGIDVTGTVTADGLTVDGDATIQNTGNSYRTFTISANRSASVNTLGRLDYDWNGTPVARIHAISGTDATNKDNGDLVLSTSADGTLKQRIFIDQGGDISFYEDTGTTAKFFWDASAETLDIGGGASNAILDVVGSAQNDWALRAENTEGTGQGWGALVVASANTSSEKAFEVRKNTSDTAMLIDGNGSVGIGTSSPSLPLEVYDATNSRILASTSNTGASQFCFGDAADDYVGRIYYDHNGNTMRFHTNGSEAMRIDSSGNMGIGTSSPYADLHVTGTIKVATGNAQGILGLGEGSGSAVNVGLWRGAANAPTTNGNYLNLGGYDGIVFATGAAAIGSQTERMRIDSSGNLLVGTTDTSLYNNGAGGNTGVLLRGSVGNIQAARSDGAPIDLNRLDADGDIAVFQKDGSTVGSIGHDDTSSATHKRTYIGYGDTGLAFIPTLNEIVGHNTSTNAANSGITLGDQNVPFENLYLSGGVYLGGTGSANLLSSYEEGTFTPTLEDPSSGNSVSGYYYRTGRYTKIGSVVHISITLSPSNMGTLTNSTDNVHITGLPFASRGSIPNDTQVLPISSFNSGSYSYVVARLAQNSTQLEIRNIYASGGGWNYVKGNELGAGAQQIVTATYLTDA